MSVDRTLAQSGEDLRRAQARSLQRSRPPCDVPGYEMERFLGAGAYGEVWVAVDRNTARRVAVKFYNHRGGVDWSLLSREVEKLAFLFADRYVVQLIDVAWDADPPYYVMEYLERGSLEDRLAEGPLPVADAVSLFRDVGVGLIHSHGKGVLHCDLKPANVLLDQDFKPRLADFGQSRLSHEQTPALGTLFYMAPEQADMRAVPDARWDVYALGALLYCMLTGQPPHRDGAAVTEIEAADGLEERLLRYRRLIEMSPRATGHRRVPSVDRELADIIDRCLEPKPDRRFANVQSVLNALDVRALRRARRPLLVLGAVGPALLLGVMSLFAWWGFRTAVDDSEQAVVERAVESNRFAAWSVAQGVAGKINQRWAVLEQAAADPVFQEMYDQAANSALESPERKKLQTFIEDFAGTHPEMNATSWFVSNREGRQLVRAPYDATTVDGLFAYRDYFHGEGKDIRPEEAGNDIRPPLTIVHRSNVFESRATGQPMVAFSVPIFDARPDGQSVVGVLAMTVHLGDFAELPPESAGSHNQFATLVDLRPDSTIERSARAGSLLEHPELDKLLRAAVAKKQARDASEGAAADEEDVAKTDPNRPKDVEWLVYLDEERVRRLEKLRDDKLTDRTAAHGQAPPADLIYDREYQDPVGGEYAGRWLAAFEPVLVHRGASAPVDAGWVVVVQERFDTATAPVDQLARGLKSRGFIAAAVVVGLLTALWGFVIVVLNESSRNRLVSTFRRRAGLKTPGFPTGTSGTGTSGTGGSARST